jgi:sec-independent protein translocase protein TatC
MESEDLKGANAPGGSPASSPSPANGDATPQVDYSYGPPSDGYPYEDSTSASTPAEPVVASSTTTAVVAEPAPTQTKGSGGGGKTPPKPPDDGGDEDDDGMLRMSFLQHLEELRARIIRALAGIGVAFVLSLVFTNQLWLIVSQPAKEALTSLGVKPPNLIQIQPMETFNIVWVKLPILCAVFLASPWVLYQVWAFIAPGLYKRERRWAAPFVICSAGLFIGGGMFAYFVAFRFGLTFLLGLGRDLNISPFVSVTEYFDLFVNVMLGVGLVFEMPVLIFFLTLLHIVSPKFLISHSRYAILAIVVLAAIVTPTPDIFNLMLFAVPMCLLFYVGIFASYLLVLNREHRRFPWAKVLPYVGVILLLIGGLVYLAIARNYLHVLNHWPYLSR